MACADRGRRISPEAMMAPGMTIKQAIGIALEGMPVDALKMIDTKEARKLILLYVHEYAKNHDVILEDSDITSELDIELERRNEKG